MKFMELEIQMMMFKVGIIQDYVPSYRAKFFEKLRKNLLEHGIDLQLLSFLPLGTQLARGDFVHLDFLNNFPQWQIQIGTRSIVFPKQVRQFRNYDALIGPLRGSSFSTNIMIFHCLKFGKPYGLWGHLRNYVNSDNSLDLFVEKAQMRNATSIFTYTNSGKMFGIEQGIESDKIFVLNNTFDLSELKSEIENISAEEISELCKRLHLKKGKTLLYIGGLDTSKRIDFLASVLNEIWTKDKEIKLLVIGEGQDKHLLDNAVNRAQVHFLDNSQRIKALAGKVSKLIVMPGRVGLIAVDAIALGIPIVTTNYKFHAPEFEYLVEGKSKFSSKFDTPSSYSELLMALMSTKHALTFSENPPSIENMLSAFEKGIQRLKLA